MFGCWRSTCTIKLGMHIHFLSSLSSNLVTCTILCMNTWSLVRLSWSLVFSVHQKDLVKDVTICQDICMSAYKLRYLDNSEDPPDVGLSSEDQATGMEEIIGIAHRVTLSRPSPASAPSTSQPTRPAMPPGDPSVPKGSVKLASDEVVIKKAVLRGIKRGAELALKGQAPASFSLGQATAGDIPFEVPTPAPHQVHCDICRNDLPTPKTLRHLRAHKGMTHYSCPKCGKHLASGRTWDMHKESCGSADFAHNCQKCGKGYHLKAKHQPAPSAADRTCLECGVVFNLLKTMRKHRAVHRGPFPCPVEGCKEELSLP